MKKTVLALATAGLMLVPTQRAQAIIGFGIHAGQDGYTVAGQDYLSLFGVPGVDLVRAEVGNPIGVGAYLYIDFIPIIDLEAGIDIYGNTYQFTLTNPLFDDVTEDFAWLRTTTWVSVQRKVFGIPMFKLYVGGGLSVSASTPLVDEDFVVEFLGNSNVDLEPETLLTFLEDNIEPQTGFHVEPRLRFKPLLIPLTIHARYRITLGEGVVPGESSFATIMIGAGIQF